MRSCSWHVLPSTLGYVLVSLFVVYPPSLLSTLFALTFGHLPSRIAAIADDTDYGAFISLMETVLELDTIIRPSSQLPPTCPPRTSPATLPTAAVASVPSSTTPDPSSCTSKKDLSCNNCKSCGLRGVGHTDGTCFQPGGGISV